MKPKEASQRNSNTTIVLFRVKKKKKIREKQGIPMQATSISQG